jgi:very-short-patch-repair endonuclease
VSDNPGHSGKNHLGHRELAALARRQQGYVTRRQLLALGVPAGTIDDWLASGRLIRVHAGVYAVGHLPQRPEARALAAVLACGPDALLSHGSAASLWGLATRWVVPFEVTAPTARQRPGIRTHRSRTLTARDRRRWLGVPVTSPARTVLAVAPQLSERRLTRMINDGRHAGLIKMASLIETLDRCPTHPGARRVRAIVVPGRGPTRSDFEDLFVSLARDHGLPMPEINATVNGYEVDALFRAHRLIVELDGWEFHSDRGAFEEDRDRDMTQAEAGFQTVRLTWERARRQPAREAKRLLAILALRG